MLYLHFSARKTAAPSLAFPPRIVICTRLLLLFQLPLHSQLLRTLNFISIQLLTWTVIEYTTPTAFSFAQLAFALLVLQQQYEHV